MHINNVALKFIILFLGSSFMGKNSVFIVCLIFDLSIQKLIIKNEKS